MFYCFKVLIIKSGNFEHSPAKSGDLAEQRLAEQTSLMQKL